MNSSGRLQKILALTSPPIAIGFSDRPPAGVERWQGGPVPAGCVFWREAMNGRRFYTESADHYNCAIGAHTHGISLPAERGSQLLETLQLMVVTEYLRMEEVPGIPTLPTTPAYIAYAPVESAGFPYDLVLIAARPASAMLIHEAALRAGAGNALANTMGRPACAALPLAKNTGMTSLSLGCMGNRTYTGLAAEDMYVCIPANHWESVVAGIGQIDKANGEMRAFYLERQAQFAPA